jgi:HAE1 family hydrophobic/amphiphilic exporter-1
MSLLGLSLVVGILVDDACGSREYLQAHGNGQKQSSAAYDGTAEIGGTVVSITLVIVVVFLPIALSSGLVSNILRNFVYGNYIHFIIISGFIYYYSMVVIR